MVPSLLSIFLDYQCNFECQHCSVGSSPRTKFPMPEELLMKALDDAKELPSIRVAVFTGGEPTLRKDVLLRGIAKARAAGYLSRVVSNGWWASTPEKARTMVNDLKAAGLDELNTSYDDFHAPFAGVEKIVNLVRAALEGGLRTAVGVIADPKSTWSSTRVRQELCDALGLTPAELEAKVYVLEDFPTPSGSAESLDLGGLDAGGKAEMGCPEVIKTLSIHPDGSVKVCCGHTQFYSKDLTLGNVAEESLAKMVSRGKENIVYWLVHMLGPKRILDEIGVGGTYTSICHACHVLFGLHREKLIHYLEANRDRLFVRDVLFSDNIKRVADVVINNKESILRGVRRIQDKDAPAQKRPLPIMA